MPNSSLNEASSTKTKAKKSNENKLNILTRPKRPIHSKKFDLSSDLLKQFDLNDDDSDDEEFIPFEETEKSKIKRLNSHEDESMPLEGADEDEDDEDVDFKSNGYSDSDDDDDNDEDEDTDGSEICDDEEMDNSQSENGSTSLNNSIKQTNKIDDETSSSKNGKTKQKGIKKTKAKNLDGEKAKKSGVAKKKKPKKKTKKNLKNLALDEDTQKIISSFKNANIKITKQKKSKTNENSIVDLDETKTKPVNTGPFVRFKKEKLKIKPNDADNKSADTKELEYPAYIICQQNESNVSKSLNNNELNSNPSSSTKQMVPKEKFLPITDTESAWVCSFCENRPNSLTGLGELFGPYRIGFNSDENVYFELEERNKFKDSEAKEETVEFKEIWFHAGCAVWSPNIYLKENRLHGIADALNASIDLKCVSCKKPGASLICNKFNCNKAFHYPCSIKNECSFNEGDFMISCKAHSS